MRPGQGIRARIPLVTMEYAFALQNDLLSHKNNYIQSLHGELRRRDEATVIPIYSGTSERGEDIMWNTQNAPRDPPPYQPRRRQRTANGHPRSACEYCGH